eukprot:1178502-Prorocentrum_minimum.AAC.2
MRDLNAAPALNLCASTLVHTRVPIQSSEGSRYIQRASKCATVINDRQISMFCAGVFANAVSSNRGSIIPGCARCRTTVGPVSTVLCYGYHDAKLGEPT